MKTETLLLIAGALGVGYLIAKKRAAASSSAVPGTPVARIAKALPEEDAEVVFVEPAVEYVPVWGGSWGPSWGGWRGGGGGGHHHHHGHHGHHGFHGYHGRRR